MTRFDVAVIGAGAAGLHCAAIAGQLGLRVVLLDHAETVAEKIRISGGGRCNFTNTGTSAAQFHSGNPDFCRSALARYTPADFIGLVERHGIHWHEKHRGQLFCDGSSRQIIAMLVAESEAGGVTRWQPCRIDDVACEGGGFTLTTTRGLVAASRLVVATGGLSVPKTGASDFGYRLARRFGHSVVETRPGLVPLLVPRIAQVQVETLAGVSLPATLSTGDGIGRTSFDDDLLFTHRGLSGPGALQISSFWQPGQQITVDLSAAIDLRAALIEAKRSSPRQQAGHALSEWLPRRLAEAWLESAPGLRGNGLADWPDRHLAALAASLHEWQVSPSGTEGYRKAEVTTGGIDTRELDSRSLESRRVPGLHFIGEVVDVTGWLGGYNFQWAWSSAAACARALAADANRAAARL